MKTKFKLLTLLLTWAVLSALVYIIDGHDVIKTSQYYVIAYIVIALIVWCLPNVTQYYEGDEGTTRDGRRYKVIDRNDKHHLPLMVNIQKNISIYTTTRLHVNGKMWSHMQSDEDLVTKDKK